MKSITRLKCYLLASICMANILQLCSGDPFASSSKGNVTPVKLFHINSGNVSTGKKEESPFGSVAKISRIIPVKRYSSYGHGKHAIRNVTGKAAHSHQHRHNSTIVKLFKPPSKIHQNKPKNSVSKTVKKSAASGIINNTSPLTTTTTTTTTTTLRPSTTSIYTTSTTTTEASKTLRIPFDTNTTTSSTLAKNPLFISTESWNYLNSILKFTEIHEIINGLSYDVIQNASQLAKTNPKAAENYLLNVFFSEFGKLKKSRMLDLGDAENNKVNTGIRYSAKRKPILNVIPLYNAEEQGNKGGMTAQSSSNSVDFKNVSGHIKNPKIIKNPSDTVKSKPNSEDDHLKTSASSQSGSTASSLMHVLVAPEFANINPTTYSPYFPSHTPSNDGFIPVFPMHDSLDHPTSLTVPMFATSSMSPNSFEIEKGLVPTLPSLIPRKARVPPKDDEYTLPSLTTSSTPKPDEDSNKGYQTIIESTTSGPKIVWYYHNQTPEDTFYPNADNFLVPPEEAAIEVVKDVPLMKPVVQDPPAKNPYSFSFSSFSSQSSDSTTFTTSSSVTDNNERDLRAASHSKNDGRSNRDSYKSTDTIKNNVPERSDNKINKNLSLHKSGTTIVDHYPDDEYSGRRKPTRYYSSATYDNSDPEKPYSNGKDENNSVKYIAYNEHDHHYPSKDEIRSSHRQRDRDRDGYYRERDEPPSRPYRDFSDGDSDYSPRPYKREKYRDHDRDTESSPYGGYHKHYHDDHGHHHGHYGDSHSHGHGWKHSHHKDFFSKAKDYFKNSDFSSAEKWFDVSIGLLGFLAFGFYIIMLIYQVFTISAGTPVGALLGKSLQGAGEMFDMFFSNKGPMGKEYIDELETIVKRAMANVKRIWMTNSFKDSRWAPKKVKGEVDAK